MELIKNYRDIEKWRRSLSELALATFGIDLETWYQSGNWRDKYIPYSFIDNDKVVANISVNVMNCEFNDRIHKYIQLGTVMTKKEYRSRGLIRQLMDEVFADRLDCDGFYLYGNAKVTGMYPRFGFEAAVEHGYSFKVDPGLNSPVKKVNYKNIDKLSFLQSFSRIKVDNDDLLMFYLFLMPDSLYYVSKFDAYVIAEKEVDHLHVYDALADKKHDLRDICACFGNAEEIRLGFAPQDTQGMTRNELHDPDTVLFVKGEDLKHNLAAFARFPELSHA